MHGHLLNPSPKWFPYFGNQKRFTPYVQELLVGLGAKEGDSFVETNAGSHAVSYDLSQALGIIPTANDLGYYSWGIGHCLRSGVLHGAAEIAAAGAAIIEEYGYTPPAGARPSRAKTAEWLEFIDSIPKVPRDRYFVRRENLFNLIPKCTGDFIYCDFAWPWKDGSATKEYKVTSDTLGWALGDMHKTDFSVASGRRILSDVVKFLDLARPRFRYVILSNQSSNYPTPEVLEPHLRACFHQPIISRRQTVPAEYLDDLGKEPFFTEYQYVFEGTRK